jgi:hypothetical protein
MSASSGLAEGGGEYGTAEAPDAISARYWRRPGM